MAFSRKTFFDTVRGDPFKGSLGKTQVEGMEGILDAFVTHGDGKIKTLAYAFATAYHEVGGRMVPVREGFADSDASARRVVRNRKYGKPVPPYNHVYYGRGLVQLTWKDNYERSSDDAGVDLVKNPGAALDPVTGAKILIKGLIDGRWNGQGKGIGHYLPPDGPDNLKDARRTVNITDKWQLIGGYYKAFLAALEAGGGVPEMVSVEDAEPEVVADEVEPIAEPMPESSMPDPADPVAQMGFLGRVKTFIATVLFYALFFVVSAVIGMIAKPFMF